MNLGDTFIWSPDGRREHLYIVVTDPQKNGGNFEVFNTKEGEVHILTKRRWLFVFPIPHTSVVPRHGADLKRLGTFIKWTTNDPGTLATLHNAVIRLVEEIGISGLVEVANSVKM